MPHKPPAIINRPSARMQWDLTNYVKDHYVEFNLNDIEFAVAAGTALGFPVTKHNIAGARETLGIQSKRALAVEANKLPKASIADILRRLEALEQRVQVYIDGCRKNQVRSVK